MRNKERILYCSCCGGQFIGRQYHDRKVSLNGFAAVPYKEAAARMRETLKENAA